MVTLVWVTGNSGVGKSTVCSVLHAQGYPAVETDEDGHSQWADRTTGEPVADPPDPVPAGWLDSYGWRISRPKVEALAARSGDRVVFLCGSAENEAEVLDLFDLVVCLVADDKTLTERLATRTTNTFGKNPEELAAVLHWNPREEAKYRRLGATVIDSSRPAVEVAAEIVAVAFSRLSAPTED